MVIGFGSFCCSRVRRSATAALRLKAHCGGLIRNEAGAALVEFTIAAVPFFLLLFGIAEVGLVYWGNKELENAVNDAARMVRTGRVQNGGMTAVDLKTLACGHTALLAAGCQARLRIDVRSAASFGQITPPTARDGSGNLKGDASFDFSPGNADEVALVTAFYDWPGFFKGPYLLRAAAPVRNEPF